MCEPVTMTAIGTWLGASASTAAAVGTMASLTAATGAISAAGVYSQAKTAKATAELNATMADRAAADAVTRGDKQAMEARRQGSLMAGAQRSRYAAAGLDIESGTPGDVIDQTDFFAQSDGATARTNARKDAAGYQSQGASYRAQADSINPGLQLAGSLLGTASSVAGKWYSYGAKG